MNLNLDNKAKIIVVGDSGSKACHRRREKTKETFV